MLGSFDGSHQGYCWGTIPYTWHRNVIPDTGQFGAWSEEHFAIPYTEGRVKLYFRVSDPLLFPLQTFSCTPGRPDMATLREYFCSELRLRGAIITLIQLQTPTTVYLGLKFHCHVVCRQNTLASVMHLHSHASIPNFRICLTYRRRSEAEPWPWVVGVTQYKEMVCR
jgi:hypothetical protein